MQIGEFDFYFAENDLKVPPLHIDTVKEIIVEGIAYELIEQKGSWFVVKESGHKCQGILELIVHLRPQKDLIKRFRQQIIDLAVRG